MTQPARPSREYAEILTIMRMAGIDPRVVSACSPPVLPEANRLMSPVVLIPLKIVLTALRLAAKVLLPADWSAPARMLNTDGELLLGRPSAVPLEPTL